MSQMEAAQRHLSRALRRLEAALEHRLAGTAPGPAGSDPRALSAISAERDELARNVAVLHEQCERLSVALNEAQHDARTLREMNGHIGRRLEGSIAELDGMLGS
jgi:hypothetical protein